VVDELIIDLRQKEFFTAEHTENAEIFCGLLRALGVLSGEIV
jgi:hypothetical protein